MYPVCEAGIHARPKIVLRTFQFAFLAVTSGFPRVRARLLTYSRTIPIVVVDIPRTFNFLSFGSDENTLACTLQGWVRATSRGITRWRARTRTRAPFRAADVFQLLGREHVADALVEI